MIKVQNLTKNFGTKRAVDGISFTVERGEVLGFLGPNGAGKSTTMRMITGFIPPTGGTVTVGGFDMVENPIPAKRLIGYLPENAPAYTDMTVHGLSEFRGGNSRACAATPRRKPSIARWKCASSNRSCIRAWTRFPKVTGIALVSRNPSFTTRTCWCSTSRRTAWIRIKSTKCGSLIRRMGEKKAIIFSTHILEEVDAVCSRAIIIDRGKIVANGTPAELRQQIRMGRRGDVARERSGGGRGAGKIEPAARGETTSPRRPAATRVAVTVFPRTAGDGDLTREVIEATNGWQVEELHTEEGRLDEVFRSITMPDTETERRSKFK